LESSTGVIFKILTGENIFIGVVKLEIDLKTQSIEVGIMIGELNFHSKGIGSQCLALIEEFATLNNLFLLTAGLMSSNSASRNLFNKNGYVEVGTKPYLLDAPSADEYVIRLQKMIKSK
jgi:RimJ/RimL family protein N-acetyltransferase